jgi:hypothetical protein
VSEGSVVEGRSVVELVEPPMSAEPPRVPVPSVGVAGAWGVDTVGVAGALGVATVGVAGALGVETVGVAGATGVETVGVAGALGVATVGVAGATDVDTVGVAAALGVDTVPVAVALGVVGSVVVDVWAMTISPDPRISITAATRVVLRMTCFPFIQPWPAQDKVSTRRPALSTLACLLADRKDCRQRSCAKKWRPQQKLNV